MKRAIGCYLLASGLASGELLRVEQAFGGMECTSCERSIIAGVKRLRGVKSAEVDSRTGSVRIVLNDRNRVRLAAIRDAIKATGFTPGEATINARGKVENKRFVVGEETFELVNTADLPEGEAEVSGSVPASGAGEPLRLNLRTRTSASAP